MAELDGRRKPLKTESVWDYPRPPRLEATSRRLRVIHRGVVIADTSRGLRILETSHPPVYYLPPGDVSMQWLRPSARRKSFCEFKGSAGYWDVDVSASQRIDGGGQEEPSVVPEAGWSYAAPASAYAALKDYVAFYANRVDECWVDEERVIAQPGDFYGGWITSDVVGPFKGAPGTMGW
jgi:uncharacterized protein (DUF427 family)